MFLQSAAIDHAAGYAYFGADSKPGQVIKVSFSQKAAIKGTKITLTETATMSDINFYSHVASGNVRLGIYNDSPTKNLLWESSSIPNSLTGGWIAVPIGSGIPTLLVLAPGTYWLCWQIVTTLDVPGYTAGIPGEGFMFDYAYDFYPTAISGELRTSETWSQYINYTTRTTPIHQFLLVPIVMVLLLMLLKREQS
ncbi:MAG: hypothetical protein A2161_09880 [Candidatus Schekmanbacteria bacterium RBG_13_48_7]|uniref:DUF4082 domain-containing protein n=1 Tax=Candidatus Schekmanbacteria bacterium RBG_13_48_7 TaxID=1817878 RepID=A0A1F7RQW7_9BACT|nr:MAG: hypothetical protein A2161_09880 [Candidatus Schekmanbacteria bacterium RBG_13_48_7]